jgi:hypothetical protein
MSRAAASASSRSAIARSRSPFALRASSIAAYWCCVCASHGRAPCRAFIASAASKCRAASGQRFIVAASMPSWREAAPKHATFGGEMRLRPSKGESSA